MNRQFYFAGIEAFYGGNSFRFESLEHLRKFVGKIDSDRKQCVKRISFRSSKTDKSLDEELLRDAVTDSAETLAYCFEKLVVLEEVRFEMRSDWWNVREDLTIYMKGIKKRLEAVAERGGPCWTICGWEAWNSQGGGMYVKCEEDLEEFAGIVGWVDEVAVDVRREELVSWG